MTFKRFEPPGYRLEGAPEAPAGDRRDGKVYVYDDDIVLAVNVALAIRRPLLISGPAGSGKSSLAKFVANVMGWRYYEDVVTARTQARDLQWTFDAIRRLSDAQANKDLGAGGYVEPGVLWWAFQPKTAATRGADDETRAKPGFRKAEPPSQDQQGDRAVVLIDEIDKADPDVPNSLLVALGSNEFRIVETNALVRATADAEPFVMITTNDERESAAGVQAPLRIAHARAAASGALARHREEPVPDDQHEPARADRRQARLHRRRDERARSQHGGVPRRRSRLPRAQDRCRLEGLGRRPEARHRQAGGLDRGSAGRGAMTQPGGKARDGNLRRPAGTTLPRSSGWATSSKPASGSTRRQRSCNGSPSSWACGSAGSRPADGGRGAGSGRAAPGPDGSGRDGARGDADRRPDAGHATPGHPASARRERATGLFGTTQAMARPSAKAPTR